MIVEQLSGGTQLKMRLSFINELEGLWKPMRYYRIKAVHLILLFLL